MAWRFLQKYYRGPDFVNNFFGPQPTRPHPIEKRNLSAIHPNVPVGAPLRVCSGDPGTNLWCVAWPPTPVKGVPARFLGERAVSGHGASLLSFGICPGALHIGDAPVACFRGLLRVFLRIPQMIRPLGPLGLVCQA